MRVLIHIKKGREFLGARRGQLDQVIEVVSKTHGAEMASSCRAKLTAGYSFALPKNKNGLHLLLKPTTKQEGGLNGC